MDEPPGSSSGLKQK